MESTGWGFCGFNTRPGGAVMFKLRRGVLGLLRLRLGVTVASLSEAGPAAVTPPPPHWQALSGSHPGPCLGQRFRAQPELLGVKVH